MSSISFPAPRPEPSTNIDGEEELYSFPFEATSSFQINPLSTHPPRTPRNSTLTPAPKDVSFQFHDQKQEEEEREDDHKTTSHHRVGCVRNEEIWRDIFLTSNGRDKAFKLIQYSIRLYLLFHTSLTTSRVLRRPTRSPWETELVRRLNSTSTGLSFTRKSLLLFNWLAPLTAITARQTVSLSSNKPDRPFLHTMLYAPPPVLLDLVNAVSDDIATLALLGLISKKIGHRASRFSDWCWFLSTLVGLFENGLERQMMGQLQREVESRMYTESMTVRTQTKGTKFDESELGRLQQKDFWLQISRAKLAMDLVFVSYDLFKIQTVREPVKTVAGLTSAILRYVFVMSGGDETDKIVVR